MSKITHTAIALVLAALSKPLLAQVVHLQDTAGALQVTQIQLLVPPTPALSAVPDGEVSLLPGLFRAHREAAKAYLLRLKVEDLLQNHFLEAGIRIDKPYDQMHQGWESPASELRGHFLGHWLSAASRWAVIDHDDLLAARVTEVLEGLKRCQQLNGGRWVGSIPEKYFAILESDQEWIWSPQYTLHKTVMGLGDDYRYRHDAEALAIEKASADWFFDWTAKVIDDGKGQTVYNGEAGGMLETWADLYAVTKDPRYLTLTERYANPAMFAQVLAGSDPLTNNHTNASLPWFEGAARVYEVTGDPRYRKIVEEFWKVAVSDRGMFATTGANAGEFWIPPGQFGRFLGPRTQEHCAVYNTLRIADYLYRWTGEAKYADYIERALYNGFLAQENPETGMVSYFLPLSAGSRKTWSTDTHDFWCCQGTMLQAQAMFESLIYHRAADGVTVSQFIPSTAVLGRSGDQIRIQQTLGADADRANLVAPGDTTQFDIDLTITSDSDQAWTLRIRQPVWALGAGTVTVDGEKALPSVPSTAGFIEIRRSWRSGKVHVSFRKRVRRESLPGDDHRFALLDGPVVLAALATSEPELAGTAPLTPAYEHQYVEGRDWQESHYWAETSQGRLALEPLYEVVDQPYAVYFVAAAR